MSSGHHWSRLPSRQEILLALTSFSRRQKKGIVGTPRFINPLLATSDADRDLTTLVYSGLTRISEDGRSIPDLAAEYQMSDNRLTYTFTLRDDLTWQDGEPVTAADVEFTIKKAQDPAVKSPRRAGWEGVKTRVIDARTIAFDLQQPYPAFLENAAMGILPKHLWEKFDGETFALNQFNSESVGSGPYKIKTIKKDNLGIPEYYILFKR
ncbi:MAG: Extracellular solute-binding protein family 5 [Candidatus Giovannonibacteria bacterium GW2011_GWA2_53_7]|uniref:Extracellular solute-binding protein family 5 n=1 Tax=Candidatus Giovannonibacteria bacterium GW2011_GWA2_53_7 TaxID=1618650 RepID=A0A0G2AP29_9BACT|nr:MAG: Extracellular solute-binding protein family 5 [Candidatus Giovannonibacteria bacterium GW2011_GWA2_53_7]